MRRLLPLAAAALLCACSKGVRFGPVASAVQAGRSEAVGAALAAKKPKGKDLRNAVCLAAAAGRTDLLALVVARGAPLTGRAPYDLCRCAPGELPPVSMNQVPLMCAAKFGRLEAVEWLLQAGADPNASTGMQGCRGRGWTALMWAAREGHAEVVKLLLSRGADPRVQMVSPKWGCMSAGPIASDLARERGHAEIASLIDASPLGGAARAGGKGLGVLGQAANILGGFVPGLSQVKGLTDRVPGASLIRTGQTVGQLAQAGAAAQVPSAAASEGPRPGTFAAAVQDQDLPALAAQGHAPSQCKLGRRLFERGGPAVEAYKWLSLCRRADAGGAYLKPFDDLKAAMSPAQVAEGEKLVAAFQPELAP